MRSGLQENLNTSYAENAVVHKLTGKVILRTIHDHLQLDAALNATSWANFQCRNKFRDY